MTCPIPNCTAAVRWHNTLCQSHARQVPEVLQKDVYRIAALLVKAKARDDHQRVRQAVSTGAG